MGRRYKTAKKSSSSKSEGKVRIKPVIITSVVALLLGLLIIEVYYILNTRIGGKLLHNNDNFAIHTLEDGHKVFPVDYVFKTADNKDLIISEKSKGKENIIINFFNSATEPCLDIMKEINELKTKLPNTYIININVGDDIPIIESYIKDNALDIDLNDVIVDLDMKMFKEFGYEGMPVLTVIDDDGTILGEIKDCYTASEIANSYEGIVSIDNATEEDGEDDISAVLDS